MLILTGPPAAGKNTIALHLARTRARCAVIDVDAVRAMLVQPHHAPWQGAEGQRQHFLGVALACQLAAGFVNDGCEVIILDVLSPPIAARYRDLLAPYAPTIAQLLPTQEECHRRFHARGPALTSAEFALLYREQSAFTDYHARIDNTDLSVAEAAAQLQTFL
jgi:predicted kinase